MSDGKIIYQAPGPEEVLRPARGVEGHHHRVPGGATSADRPNGAGKSTLLRILAGGQGHRGDRPPDPGPHHRLPEQELPLDESRPSRTLPRCRPARAESRYYEVTTLMGEAEGEEAEKLSEYDELQTAMDTWDLGPGQPPRAGRPRPPGSALRLPRHEPLRGERRRVALSSSSWSTPTCWTSPPTTWTRADAWLETHLSEYEGTVILITHDRYFLDNVVGGCSRWSGLACP